ncbi:MAG: metal-binding protein, partial [Candidatus Riflebacteria bacterium]|nr:metal-binding protein [Candidatus Riflebacteria bacterium]
MKVSLAYLGRSTVTAVAGGHLFNLVPNLRRDPVAFDAPLARPRRFREAISALHDVVISDLRFRRRDKTAYLEWKRGEQSRLTALAQHELHRAKQEILSRRQDVPEDLETSYRQSLRLYWRARQAYGEYLRKNDHELWRTLMPCDPVVTVSDDV